MNQTRTFLLFALLAVAYLLWTAWEKDYAPAPAPTAAVAASSGTAPSDNTVPGAVGAATPAIASTASASAAAGQLITISNDVLRLTVDTRGGSVVRADLLAYPAEPVTRKHPNPPPVRLLDDAQAQYFVAQSGLVSAGGPAPDHRALFQSARTHYELADGVPEVRADLTWRQGDIKVTKTYTLKRGQYVVALDQRIDNTGSTPWQGNAYEQLQRAPRPEHHGWLQNMTDPSAASFYGAAWYSPEDHFQSLKFDKFQKDPLQQSFGGGWAAMLQHYFFAAWIPPAQQKATYSTDVVNAAGDHPTYLIRAVSPTLTVAPGQSQSTGARLYIGPKLVGTLDSVAPGLALATNYGVFTVIAQPMHALLSWLEKVSGNWGVAIILLVLIIKGLTWKLTAAQYRSSAKMRKLQPRVAALKERYGDDKQKMQMAMMELYKKEKVNPMTGCLPVLITIPIFYGLYEVLRESVELRQAPFVGWIHDLSAPDPFFVLPAVYTLVMLGQQYLMPATGMDPTQAKMMKFMPLIFAVLFAFFPAGLCLYYVVNGMVSLGQQWYITHKVENGEAKAKA
ncbi:MAG TPA: membrane protein insertase YidC [Frateuria sp.]|uniref:membrane protein insertase YidC n=1 Tax=Frateuria sp. TaxID=2211372 RepID=UPI002D80D21E|nr:membrane protein insertase YidC [Frateuria sp.]HET6804128.1 membrane protein insertase YidC [Frateuria sp.]